MNNFILIKLWIFRHNGMDLWITFPGKLLIKTEIFVIKINVSFSFIKTFRKTCLKISLEVNKKIELYCIVNTIKNIISLNCLINSAIAEKFRVYLGRVLWSRWTDNWENTPASTLFRAWGRSSRSVPRYISKWTKTNQNSS